MALIPEGGLFKALTGGSGATGGSESTTSSARRSTDESARERSSSETAFERDEPTGGSVLSGALRSAAMSVPPVAMARATMQGMATVARVVHDAVTPDAPAEAAAAEAGTVPTAATSPASTTSTGAASHATGDATSTGRYSDAQAGIDEAAMYEHGGAAEPAAEAGRTQLEMRRGEHRGDRARAVMMLNAQKMLLQGATFIKDVHPLNNPITGRFFERALDKANINPETHLQDKQADLEREQTLKLMLDVMHALGASHETMEALDGTYEIQVVPDDQLRSDAAYDPDTKKILISESLVKRTQENMHQLRDEGAIHTGLTAALERATTVPLPFVQQSMASTNSVRNAEKLDTSEAADEIVKTASLLIHEVEHAQQDERGEVTATEQQLQEIGDAMMAEAAYLHPVDRAMHEQMVLDELEMLRIAAQEYDAYHRQEVKQFQLGAVTKTRVTIDDQGNPLPHDQAVRNIFALQRGEPMVYGPSAPAAGAHVTGAGHPAFDAPLPPPPAGAAGHDHGGGTHTHSTAATYYEPTTTYYDPGAMVTDDLGGRRIPGEDLYGRRIPGEDVNGRRIPGDELYGRRIPGEELYGRRIPGEELDGRRIPGEEIGGRRIPGSMIDDAEPAAEVTRELRAPGVDGTTIVCHGAP